MEILIV